MHSKCNQCSQPAVAGRSRCQRHLDAAREIGRKQREKRRAAGLPSVSRGEGWQERQEVNRRARMYGVTPEGYAEMYTDTCPICAAHGRRMVIDHDHSTGEVRGFICHQCNGAIGMLGDSAEGVQRALNYLRR